MRLSRARKHVFELAAIFVLAAPAFPQQTPIEANKLAPFVPSPQPIVERMLQRAGLKQNEILYDLGCGDGRILITAAQRFGAKAVGVEISRQLVDRAEKQVHDLALDNRVQVIYGDLMNVNVSSADVVALYLLTHSNDQLRPEARTRVEEGCPGGLARLQGAWMEADFGGEGAGVPAPLHDLRLRSASELHGRKVASQAEDPRQLILYPCRALSFSKAFTASRQRMAA